MLRFKILVWLLVSAATIFARSIPTINAEKAHEAARQQVVWQGRVCTMATLADDFLQSVYGKSSYHGLSPVQVVYGWRLRPDVWKDEPMILIPDSELRRQLGISQDYAAFAQLFDDTLGYRLNSLGADLPTQMRQLLKETPAFVELDEKVGTIILLTQGQLIQPRPDSIPPLSPWRVEAEVLYASTPGWVIMLAVLFLLTVLGGTVHLIRHHKTTNVRNVVTPLITIMLCVSCSNKMADEFSKCVVSHEWLETETHDILPDGSISDKDFWEDYLGGAHRHYLFDTDSVTCLSSYSPVLPPTGEEKPKPRYVWHYDSRKKKLYVGKYDEYTILSFDEEYIEAIGIRGWNSKGVPHYNYMKFRRMTDR